jgi:putative SOS response-associated peptidase YedK
MGYADDSLRSQVAGSRKPTWQKGLLTLDRIESERETETYERPFREARCLIPSAGWYEL